MKFYDRENEMRMLHEIESAFPVAVMVMLLSARVLSSALATCTLMP